MKNEIITDLPFAEYLAIDAVNSTPLKQLLISPLQYKWSKENDEDSPSKLQGRASHTATLEPRLFPELFTTYEGKRDKRHKAYQEFLEKNEGKTILKQDEHDAALNFADAVHRHERAGELLHGARVEVTILWTHPRTGLRCKSRIDLIGKEAAGDLKGSRNIAPASFCTDAARFGYDLQFAFYADALASVGIMLPFKCIAGAFKPPHDVAVYHVPEKVLEMGRIKYERALDKLIECREKNVWPGLAPVEELELRLPSWADPRYQDDAPDIDTDLGTL